MEEDGKRGHGCFVPDPIHRSAFSILLLFLFPAPVQLSSSSFVVVAQVLLLSLTLLELWSHTDIHYRRQEFELLIKSKERENGRFLLWTSRRRKRISDGIQNSLHQRLHRCQRESFQPRHWRPSTYSSRILDCSQGSKSYYYIPSYLSDFSFFLLPSFDDNLTYSGPFFRLVIDRRRRLEINLYELFSR